MSSRSQTHLGKPTVGRLIAGLGVIAACGAALAAAPAAGAATRARSAPFTVGVSASPVPAGSRVTISGVANARAGTQLTIASNAISSALFVGTVPAVRTPVFVEGTYRTTITVPPAIIPALYAIRVSVGGKMVAATSLRVTARSHGPKPAAQACAGIAFTVLHDDTSGGVTLPAGRYTVASRNLQCSTASADFTLFLDRYNGRIPGWSATTSGAGRGTFTQNGTGSTFTVTHAR